MLFPKHVMQLYHINYGYFRVKVRVRIIRVRGKVLGNSDHCVLKFNSVLRY